MRPPFRTLLAFAVVSLLLCVALPSSSPLAAQQADTVAAADTVEAPRYEARELEVSVTRSLRSPDSAAAAVSLVNRSLIQDAQPRLDLEESLSGVPGVTVNNRYNKRMGTRIAIRGFGARSAFGVRGVRLQVDGIPLTMPDGQAQLDALDLGSVGRIEVLRGPASVLYGNAAGGVISIETEEPPARPFAGQAEFMTSDYGTGDADNLRRMNTKVGGQAGDFEYLASFSHVETDGFRIYAESEYSLLNTNLRHRLDEDSHLTLILNAYHEPWSQNPSSLPAELARTNPDTVLPRYVESGSGGRTTQIQGGLGYSRWIGDDRLDVRAYGASRSLGPGALPFAAGGKTLFQYGGLRSTYRARTSLGDRPLHLTGGLDVEFQRNDRRSFTNAGGGVPGEIQTNQLARVHTLGPFLQGQLQLLDQLELTAGARFDAFRFESDDFLLDDGDDSGSRSMSAFSPMAGVRYTPLPELTVYGTVATSFQTPTTTELKNAPPEPGEPFQPQGFNETLDPQEAVSYEVGVRGRIGDRLRYETALYSMDVSDQILPFGVEEAPDREFYRNLGEADHRGVEVSLQGRLAGGLTGQVAYTYSDFTFEDDGRPDAEFEGNQIPGIPPHELYARARYTHDSGVFAEVDGRHVDDFFVNDANTARNRSYTLVNVRLGVERLGGRLGVAPYLSVTNALDQRYNSSVVVNAFGGRYYEPGPDRSYYLGVKVPFGWNGSR